MSIKSRNILFTFDYELFLGNKSGNVMDCLIVPTQKLSSLLNHFKMKGIFFIDTIYIKRLEEISQTYPQAKKDLLIIKDQLYELLKAGHYIFPHLHPHWIDAEYRPNTNDWCSNNLRYYTFSTLPQYLKKELFEYSINLICDIAKKIHKDYKVDTYRAGGWSIQPFESFRPYFLKYKIIYEFSVIPGKYQISDAHNFDFRNIPVNTTIYSFENDISTPLDDGRFKELAISTINISKIEKWFNFKINGILKRLGRIPEINGSTVSLNSLAQGDIYESYNRNRFIASFEGLNPFLLFRYKKIIKQVDYFQFISHPKLISPYEFKLIHKLLLYVSKFKLETDFRKIQ
jgi:hypothetical protein